MKAIIKEYKSLIFIVGIIIIANVFAFTTFKSLQGISENITVATRQEYPVSLIAKQILLEFRSSENSTRSYYLTQDEEYINSFQKSDRNIQKLLLDLKFLKKYNEDVIYIDSVTYYTRLGLNSIKMQSNLEILKEL